MITSIFYSLPYQLDLQYFAQEGGEVAAGEGNPGGEQLSFEPKYGMSEFSSFLEKDENAKLFFESKVQQALLQHQEQLKPQLLEEAKKLVASQSQKQPWEIEIDKLKAENAAKEAELIKGNTRTQLATRLTNDGIQGVTVEALEQFCLRDTPEASNEAYDSLMSIIKVAAESHTKAELEKRSKQYVYNPMGGNGGSASTDSLGVNIARQIMSEKATNNTRTKAAQNHFFNQ